MPRDIPFDEEVPERSEEARTPFADIRPLTELEKRRQRFAAEFSARAKPSAAQVLGAEVHDLIEKRIEHGATPKKAHKDAHNHLRFGTR